MYKTGKIKIFIYFQRSQSSSRENRGSSLAPQLTGGSSRDSSRSSKERPISGLPSTLAKQLAGSSAMPPGLYFTVKNVEKYPSIEYTWENLLLWYFYSAEYIIPELYLSNEYDRKLKI